MAGAGSMLGRVGQNPGGIVAAVLGGAILTYAVQKYVTHPDDAALHPTKQVERNKDDVEKLGRWRNDVQGDLEGVGARLTKAEETLGKHGEWITAAKERIKQERRDEKEAANLAERREFRKALAGVLESNQAVLARMQEVLAAVVASPDEASHGR